MKDQYENLNNVFNVSGEIVKSQEPEIIEKVIEKIDPIKSGDIEKDYEYTRGNLYSLIEKGQEAINGVLELAQETESPRAYEVFGQLIKNVSDTTDKLINLQQKMKELEDTGKSSSPTTVNNTLFVGSTAELSKMLKSQLKELNDK